ncbi:MAG: hypothetical protein ACOX3P_07060 [Saccharofermentanales bacterium]
MLISAFAIATACHNYESQTK